jgi:GAF domain
MQACLHFMLAQNDSMAVDFAQTRLPIDDQSVVGRAVLGKKAITIADVATLPTAALATPNYNHTFDRQTGYQARSMLTVPMLSAMGDVMGVIQLINKKRSPDQKLLAPADFAAQVVPFDDQAVGEVKSGKCDAHLFQLFVAGEVYKKIL